jgi:hypothetical protein
MLVVSVLATRTRVLFCRVLRVRLLLLTRLLSGLPMLLLSMLAQLLLSGSLFWLVTILFQIIRHGMLLINPPFAGAVAIFFFRHLVAESDVRVGYR